MNDDDQKGWRDFTGSTEKLAVHWETTCCVVIAFLLLTGDGKYGQINFSINFVKTFLYWYTYTIYIIYNYKKWRL